MPTISKEHGEIDEVALIASAFWRRLDTSGSDAARLYQTKTGWRLAGTAVFLQDKAPARLDYTLDLGADWTTERGVITGFVGGTIIDLMIVRDAASWSMNGTKTEGLEHLKDLDLGFTPATNLPQVRRANLRVGESIDFAVAWWEPGTATLVELPQHYRRRSERTYWYESPSGPYRAELEIASNVFVRSYPGLWVLESD
ncbi:MAG TPA: putative glycolipid-binding domain-containing protein [Opitutus sp.]|nr:putative glycolipid-binding domain-containing protein [Opitutus sp.]